MQTTLLVGLIIITGFVLGELVRWIALPKVTGYILAGLLFNPSVFEFVPDGFPQAVKPVVDIALAFITFSIGGSISLEKLRQTGSRLFVVTVAEGVGAFVCIFAGILLLFLLLGEPRADLQATSAALAFAILMASLGAPTDPSATLAVEHEYGARGRLSQAILGIAAFDDALGILIFSLGSAGAAVLLNVSELALGTRIYETLYAILGGAGLGVFLGWLFNLICRRFRFLGDSEGAYIVLILGLLCVGFGSAAALGMDELLTTMLTGWLVANFNPRRERIFHMMERYTEELIFLLFFTLSAMHLDFSFSSRSYLLILGFVVFRAAGKWLGVNAGSRVGGLGPVVRKYAAGGLIPQGGIVIGLALMLQNQPQFEALAGLLMNAVMGATLVHEIIGPLTAKFVLKRAGEIKN